MQECDEGFGQKVRAGGVRVESVAECAPVGDGEGCDRGVVDEDVEFAVRGGDERGCVSYGVVVLEIEGEKFDAAG